MPTTEADREPNQRNEDENAGDATTPKGGAGPDAKASSRVRDQLTVSRAAFARAGLADQEKRAGGLAGHLRGVLPVKGKRIVLRAMDMADATALQTLASDSEVAQTTATIPHPFPEGLAEKWTRAAMQLMGGGNDLALAIAVPEPNKPRHSGRFAGMVTLSADATGVHGEIGFWVGRPYWNKGFASEAVRLLAEIAVIKMGMDRLYALVMPGNEASARVLENAGFDYERPMSREMPARGRIEVLDRFVIDRHRPRDPRSTPRRRIGAKPKATSKPGADLGLQSVADLMLSQQNAVANAPAGLPVPQAGGSQELAGNESGPVTGVGPPRYQASQAANLLLVVAVALVDSDGRVLLAERPKGKAMAGMWEFPGGKVASRETPEAALIRELKEELGIDVTASCLAPFSFASHAYPEFHLLMPLYVCRVWQGIPSPREGQRLTWVKPTRMGDYAMPPADEPLVAMLRDLL